MSGSVTQKLIISTKLPTLVKKKTNIKCRLLCFPWAGGGTPFYIRWGRAFPENIEVLAVRPPGRESRLNEPAYDHIADLAQDVGDVIQKQYSDKPIAFFGHSLGGRLCFETARYLIAEHSIEPQSIFVSSAYSPQSTDSKSVIGKIPNDVSDEYLTTYLKKFDGTPPELFENKELMKTFLKPLRDDLNMLKNYLGYSHSSPPFTCPVIAFDGEDDVDHHLQGWQELTTGDFDIHMFKGGHFYLQSEENGPLLRNMIVKYIKQSL